MAKKKKKVQFSTDLPCVACEAETENGNCFHHIKTQGSRGSNEAHNKIPVCQRCHNVFHNNALSDIIEMEVKKIGVNGEAVLNWLVGYGWYFCDISGKWLNPKEF